MRYPPKPPIVLTERERQVLENLAHSRTIERRSGERATIILQLAAGTPKQAIAQEVHLTRKIVYLWYDRWLAAQDRLHSAGEASDKEYRQLIEEILKKNTGFSKKQMKGTNRNNIFSRFSTHPVSFKTK